MRNIIVIPAVVLGCAVLGAIAGGVYFGILIGVSDWLAGHAPATDAQWAALGARASIPAFAFGIPVGAWTGSVICEQIAREAHDVPALIGALLGICLLIVCTVFPLYQSFFAALKTLTGGTLVATTLSFVGVAWICGFPTKVEGWLGAAKSRTTGDPA